MTSHASVMHAMIGELREDLQLLVAAQGKSYTVDMAKMRLADIVALAGCSVPVARAADQLAQAVDRVIEIQAQARAADAPHGEEQSSRAVNLLEDPLAALSAGVHRLP